MMAIQLRNQTCYVDQFDYYRHLATQVWIWSLVPAALIWNFLKKRHESKND